MRPFETARDTARVARRKMVGDKPWIFIAIQSPADGKSTQIPRNPCLVPAVWVLPVEKGGEIITGS